MSSQILNLSGPPSPQQENGLTTAQYPHMTRNVRLRPAMLLYNWFRQGFLPFLNRPFGDIFFRSHDHHPPAALRRFELAGFL